MKAGRIDGPAYKQKERFEAVVRFARVEGILPVPALRTPSVR